MYFNKVFLLTSLSVKLWK